jgi:DNA-binding response OmpR family regulator
MPESSTKPLVAIVNTAEEIALMLKRLFEREGFHAVPMYVPDLKQQQPDPQLFLLEHDPPVVLWDIAIPYEENWAFFQSVERSEAARGRRFVLTTTNKRVLEQLVGPTGTHELVGKPFDLEEILMAVRRALEAEQPRRL